MLRPDTHPAYAHYHNLLHSKGARAADGGATRLATEGRYDLIYVPFHHVNKAAKIAIVGITPGTTQIELSYDSVQSSLRAGLSGPDIFTKAKEAAAFGGRMRENLIRMLDHFRFPDLLGLEDSADLWGKASHLLESTSVVPHAAFKGGKMFAGGFEEILGSRLLRGCFEDEFLPSLLQLGPQTLFIALGPTPSDALDWCVARRFLRREQLLGAFAHPSKGAGTQIDVYLGVRKAEELHADDPVRYRVPWLKQAYARMNEAVAVRFGGILPPREESIETLVAPAPKTERVTRKVERAAKPVGQLTATTSVDGIHAFVARGRNKGKVLRPHVQDGGYIVSPSRYEADYIKIPLSEPLKQYLEKGLRLRMSAPNHAPSLVMPAPIYGWR